jgi:hypothetical protein
MKQEMTHHVQIVLPLDGGGHAVIRSIYNPETCERLNDSVAITNEKQEFGGWESIDKYWEEPIIKNIKYDLQAAVCLANGHLHCDCIH